MGKTIITLETFGWNAALETSFEAHFQHGFLPARVAEEDKHHFILFTPSGTLLGKITGKFLHNTPNRAELPKVGDWVAYSLARGEEDRATIHAVLPRRTKLSRKVAGRETTEQVLVTNVDIGFAVQALDRSFNPALLQRHLGMIVEGGAKPVVVLNKTDLCDDILEKLATVERVAPDAPAIAVSAKTGRAVDSLTRLLRPGQTVVFIGASGVGKSSLINHLYGEDVLPTTEVRERDSKGRHTTSWREMIVLPNGALVIDTPGMREFQMWLSGEAGKEAFADVEAIALGCHFRSCNHTVEKRCAVLDAVNTGVLPRERYDNYVKLKRELDFLTQAAHRRDSLERKKRTKVARRPSRQFDQRSGER